MSEKKYTLTNDGLSKCKLCGKEVKPRGFSSHYRIVHEKFRLQPNGAWNKGLTKETDERVKQNAIASGLVRRGVKIGPMSEKHKKSISEGMKKAHKEGRAWNIGKSRWNNDASWPEKFFMQVIENEFDDKNYIREYPIGNYSIDFAWPDKMKAIEIDGSQHKRFKEQMERDKRKNDILIKNGWEYIRVDWCDVCNDTKIYIKKLYDFIHN